MSSSQFGGPPAALPRMSFPANGWLVMVLMILVGALVFQVLSGVRKSPSERTVTPRGELSNAEKSTIAVYKAASQSVVPHCDRESAAGTDFLGAFMKCPAAWVSGFVWDDKGHIVTNLHVISDALGASVTLPDKSVWQARLVGRSEEFDLAVLKIDAPSRLLAPIPLGTSDDLQVGQYVLAIGNPFGLDPDTDDRCD